MSVLLENLVALYGVEVGRATYSRLAAMLDSYLHRLALRDSTPRSHDLDERDAILITYGDQVREVGSPDTRPLETLAAFCARYVAGLVNGIHVLPFYPYSSDDGFAVIDYRSVDPALGIWDDIERLGRTFDLMFDAVINHVSAESRWFERFLQDDAHFRDFFIVVPAGADLSKVVRPRALPLLTHFRTPSGEKNVWTTFSADQVDLNYHDPDVLLEIVDTLLFYVEQGARFIRLDAVAYLWKEAGTPCIHLPQTHRIVRLMRAVLDQVAPHVMLITETNVPHSENLSYFGHGSDEAQMVYNFALPPLVLHTFHTGNAGALSAWARDLVLPSNQVTFFNFLASHDGVGLNPVRGILSDAEISALVQRTRAHGGLVAYKQDPDGSTSPYELNINYFDALSSPHTGEPLAFQVSRFIAAQAIMLCLAGVPGIYFHSLFGSVGWSQGVAQTGQNRTINREKCERNALERELRDPTSRRHMVFTQYGELLRTRAAHAAFHPRGTMRVLDAGEAVFAVLRIAPEGTDTVLCLHNVIDRPRPVPSTVWHSFDHLSTSFVNALTGRVINPAEPLVLEPYQVLWIQVFNGQPP